MFQEKSRMEYTSQMAPYELKNRTWSSIQREKRKRTKQRRLGLCVAACFAGVMFVSNLMYQNSTIVKINNVPISYFEVSIGNVSGDIPFSISEERKQGFQGEIPMEIMTKGRAHVVVSEGSIRTEDSEDYKEEVTKLDIEGETVIFWSVEGDSNGTAICTITTENEVYQYVMEMDKSSCKLRLTDKNEN